MPRMAKRSRTSRSHPEEVRMRGLRVSGLPVSTARARRRMVTLMTVALVAIAVGGVQIIGAFAAGSPSRAVDRDLSSYVLFALDRLHIKGGNVGGFSGNIGVKNADTNPGDSEASLSAC